MTDQLVIARAFAAWVAAGTAASWDGTGPAYTAATVYPIFLGPDMPATPDRLIVVTPTTVMQRMARIDQGLQVRVRGVEYGEPDDVHDMAQAIIDLANPNGFPTTADLGAPIGRAVILTGPRSSIARDDGHRHGFVANFVVRYRKVAPYV